MGKINFHIRNFESPYQTPGAGSYWDFFENFYKNSIYNNSEEIFVLYPLVIEKDISETNIRHNFVGPLDISRKMYDFRVSKGEYSLDYPLDLKIGDINITTPETISLKYANKPPSELQKGRIFSVIFENNAWQSWGIFNENVKGIFLDNLGRLFASTSGGVSFSSNLNNFSNITKIKGLGSNLVNDVFVTNLGTIYVATDFGLAISVDNGETFENKVTNNGLGSNKVNKVFYDNSSGKLYVATSVGLSISIDGGVSFENKTTSNGLGSNNINSVFVDVLGNLYAATENGLSISYDNGESFINKTISDGLAFDLCRDIFVSNLGVVAVATDNGISISTDNCSTFFSKTKSEGLPSNFIRSVYFDYSEKLYVGTSEGLLTSSDLLDTFELLTIDDGLPNNNVNDILKNELTNDLIVSTSQGVSVLQDGAVSFNRTTNNGLGSFFKNTVINFLGKSILNSRDLTNNQVQPMSNYEDFCLHFYIGFKGKFDNNKFGTYPESYVIFYPGNDTNSDEVISYNF